jgi:hypothetical protein
MQNDPGRETEIQTEFTRKRSFNPDPDDYTEKQSGAGNNTYT